MAEKPRILCLHGGGVSARIFELQMRYFIKSLSRDFRLVFADGPWLSEMHDDLKPVYTHMGPCYRWASWKPNHVPMDASSAIRELEFSLIKAMAADDGQGEWVGVLGFSQGAKLAFSMLLENQLRLDRSAWAMPFAGVNWRFGIIMAGRAPPYSLDPARPRKQHFSSLTKATQGYEQEVVSPPFNHLLRTPTLHVHGLRDGGLDMHRDLLRYWTSPGRAQLVEWDGGHRIPIKTGDVERITEMILDLHLRSTRFIGSTGPKTSAIDTVIEINQAVL